MTRQEILKFIEEQLRDLEAPALPERLTEDFQLRETGLDSIGKLELVAIVERTFKVAVSDETYHRISTIGDLMAAIEGALEIKARAPSTTSPV